MSSQLSPALWPTMALRLRPPCARTAALVRMADRGAAPGGDGGSGGGGGGLPGAPSYEQFKNMMQRDIDPDKLTMGEQVQRGTKNSWVNPAYWNRQFVQASHIANNVPNGSRVIEVRGARTRESSAYALHSQPHALVPSPAHRPLTDTGDAAFEPTAPLGTAGEGRQESLLPQPAGGVHAGSAASQRGGQGGAHP